MTPAERYLLIEVAEWLAFHIENTYTHLKDYVPGELTSGLNRRIEVVMSEPHVYDSPTTGKEPLPLE